MGAVKSMMAELADESNLAQAFSLLPMTWAFGFVIGLIAFAFQVACTNISDAALAHFSVASYLDLKIAGQVSSQILSGTHTLICYHVWLLLLLHVYLWS